MYKLYRILYSRDSVIKMMVHYWKQWFNCYCWNAETIESHGFNSLRLGMSAAECDTELREGSAEVTSCSGGLEVYSKAVFDPVPRWVQSKSVYKIGRTWSGWCLELEDNGLFIISCSHVFNRWLCARLRYLQCIRTGDRAVLHYAIVMYFSVLLNVKLYSVYSHSSLYLSGVQLIKVRFKSMDQLVFRQWEETLLLWHLLWLAKTLLRQR